MGDEYRGGTIFIGILVLAGLALFVTLYFALRPSTKSPYAGFLSNDRRLLARSLVNDIAPSFRGRRFTQKEVSDALTAHNGTDYSFDSPVYFSFVSMLNDGTLTEQRLLDAIK